MDLFGNSTLIKYFHKMVLNDTNMLKKIFLILVPLLIISYGHGQIDNRKYIKGKINVPAKDDPENISIYNKSSAKGTLTDETGNFKIFAAVDDTLTISSIQYSDFDVVVDKEVFDNKTMTIYLKESVSILDEVVVRPYDLTGDLKEDAGNIKTLTMQPITKSSKSIVYGYTGGQEYAADGQTSPEKALMDQSYFRYGLNFVNLFKLLVETEEGSSSSKRSYQEKGKGNLKEIYSNNFFQTYLKIPREKINDFIDHAEQNGLDEPLLKKGNEMELIQFLVDTSRSYRENKL